MMENDLNNKFYTISEINSLIHEIFNSSEFFHGISLKGEIANYKGPNKSGHFYFTLKDKTSQISAVIFKFDSFSIKDELKNGDEVIVTGDISTYAPSGTYQIIIRQLYLYGKGKLLIEKEKLKKKLQEEGLFDEEHKKKIPLYPTNIAIITGKNSAAAADFKHNLLRRWPISNITFYETLVQGEKAPKEIIKSLSEALNNNPDLIIIGRGGGAEDDLNAFDNEELVRFIYEKVNVPIISAVGHEINTTFTDLVCDDHASTPTGACELAVPDIDEFINNLENINSIMKDRLMKKINFLQIDLLNYQKNSILTNFSNIIDSKLNYIEKSLTIIKANLQNKLSIYEHKIVATTNLLNQINPYNLLEKGYSIIKNSDGKIINNIDNIKLDDVLRITLYNGEIVAKVEEIKNGK